MAAQIITNKSTVVEAIATADDPALHYVLEGLFEHFLPSHNDDDLRWFLEIANSQPVMQSLISSSVTVVPPTRCMKHCLLRVLTATQNEEPGSQCKSDDVLERLLHKKV